MFHRSAIAVSIHRYETKDGTRYRVRWREPGGRMRSRTVASKKDANRLDIDVKARKQRSEPLPQPSSWTLDRAWDEWLSKRGSKKAPATIESYTALWEAHMRGQLGAYPLTQLVAEPMLFEDHDVVLEQRGVGDSSRRKLLMVTSGVMKSCVHWRLIPRNPIRDVPKPPTATKRNPRPFPPVLVERLRLQLSRGRASRGPTAGMADAALVSVMAYAGLRPQEALALTFADLGEKTISVDKAIRYGVGVGPTKTGKPRHPPLPDPVRDDLAELRTARGNPPGGSLIFDAPDGGLWTRWRYSNWRSRVWRPAVEAVAASDPDLKWVANARPYDCRGSFISLQLRAGVPPLDLAAIAGHSSQVMFTHYARVIEELADAPQKLDAEGQILNARDAVREEDAESLAETTIESLKPDSEAKPRVVNMLYGPRRQLKHSKRRSEDLRS